MKKFRIYQASVQFYQGVSKLTLREPLRDQLLRSASSTALNISEGYGRISPRDKKKFYRIALGSCRESLTALELAGIDDPILLDLGDHVAAGLYKLINRGSP